MRSWENRVPAEEHGIAVERAKKTPVLNWKYKMWICKEKCEKIKKIKIIFGISQEETLFHCCKQNLVLVRLAICYAHATPTSYDLHWNGFFLHKTPRVEHFYDEWMHFFGLQNLNTIHCHYNVGRARTCFLYNSDCNHLKEVINT